MKIRQGFVSNSSSSSFIVAFPKDFAINSNNVRDYLFGEQENVTAYDWIGTFSTKEIADQVTRDMRGQTPNEDGQINEAMCGHLLGAPNLNSFRTLQRKDGKGYDYDWDAYEKACDEHKVKMLERLSKEFEGMDIFTFEYSDNDGNFYCTMEHGGIFKNVPHMQISKH